MDRTDPLYLPHNVSARDGASRSDHADEIPMLERALLDSAQYTAEGLRTMRDRLNWLRGLTVPVLAEVV